MFVFGKILFFTLWGTYSTTPFIERECAEACKTKVVIVNVRPSKKQDCFNACTDQAYKAARDTIKKFQLPKKEKK